MQTLDLTPEEIELLQEMLRHSRQEIDIEVSRTDSREFKERLKHRRQVLDSALRKLEALPVAA